MHWGKEISLCLISVREQQAGGGEVDVELAELVVDGWKNAAGAPPDFMRVAACRRLCC